MEYFSDPQFWVVLGQIMIANILLSGDNAVVIALASRNLPPEHQKKAILLGSGAAILLRVVLTIFVSTLLDLQYVKLIGAALLLWIAIKLLVPEEGHGDLKGASSLSGAVKTILFADFVMSLDNVLAVAGPAKGYPPAANELIIIGLALSIPLIIFGSTLVLKLMDRYPVIITGGAALLGYVAGEMAVKDGAIANWVNTNAHWLHSALPIIGAVVVVCVGKYLAARQEETKPA
ncbi:MAG TPA: TerC family protein [Rhodocyclaceae bacterium]|jgi:YjbE family integral membrane protein|nr:TerC family protein [Rhodocyclaceae bacterium]